MADESECRLIREKRHRLPPVAYRGNVTVAFTVNTSQQSPFFKDLRCYLVAALALHETFLDCHGNAGVFVFMPTHCHLIVSGRDESTDLLKLVAVFKQRTTYRVRRQFMIPFGWQKDFYDEIIRSPDEYGDQVRYILRNPVRQGLHVRWQDWPMKGVLGQNWQDLAANIGSL